MKKLLALLLALVMVFSLVACGAAEDEDDSKDRRRSSASDEDETDETGETDEDTIPEEDVDETKPVHNKKTTDAITEPEETEPEETEPEEEDETPEGAMYKGRYENEYFGYGCKLGSGWEFATDKEITKQIGYPTSVYDEAYEGIFCDLMAAGTGSSNAAVAANFNMLIQEESFLTRSLTDEQFAESAAQSGAASLEYVGATNVQSDITTVDFAGRECAAVVLTSCINGIDVCQLMVIVREGDYASAIAITSTELEHCMEIAEFFYEL